jgi:phosphoribosylaminoimidazole carboxylase PurE protein
MVASLTPLPVIGVPIRLSTLEGMDSLLSIVQMPSGVPVATVGIGQARNAGILALRILALADSSVSDFVNRLMEEQTQRSLAKVLPPTVG